MKELMIVTVGESLYFHILDWDGKWWTGNRKHYNFKERFDYTARFLRDKRNEG